MNLGVTNKRVVVTGASRGIGAQIAHSFLSEGSKTCIVSRGSPDLYKVEALLKSKFSKDNILLKECDCRDSSALISLRKEINNDWGGVDIVIVNVGDGQSVNDAIPEEEQWKKTWDNNFESALNTARTFLPLLKKSNGSLLFISSIAGIEAFGAPVDYSTAKSAILALAKNMARKLANEVRVNVVAPGNVFFPGGAWDKKINNDPKGIKKLIKSTVPMNRFGTPEEIADASVFLCSERASFITGAVLIIDGGQTVGIL